MSITKDENLKIRHLMATIEAMEGTNIPFPTARKIFEVYKELKEIVGNEEVEG
ncbi:MAG: hypothetical protein WCX79_00655 [Candidatus Paceibacterota bacterium]|jgi:hypothetical protein